MRKQATIHLTKELLAERLGLKDGISIADMRVDQFRGTVEILLDGEQFEPVQEAQMPYVADPTDVFVEKRKTLSEWLISCNGGRR